MRPAPRGPRGKTDAKYNQYHRENLSQHRLPDQLKSPSATSAQDEDEDEDVEIKISPTGSVLSPSPNPYDKTQKLRQANAQLMASRLPPRPPGKVRFNDSVITSDDPSGDMPIRSKRPKTNVTLPPNLKKN